MNCQINKYRQKYRHIPLLPPKKDHSQGGGWASISLRLGIGYGMASA